MDPSGQEANPYAYAAGNPVSYKDLSGLITVATAEIIGRIIQAAFEVAGILSAAAIGAAHPLAAAV